MSSGHQGDVVEGDAEGVFYGVQDGGGGAVHREFADALGAESPVFIRDFREVHVNGGKVGGGGA